MIALAIIIPTLNEAGNVAELVARLDRTLAGIAWEAIFVDDDSRDGTREAVYASSDLFRRLWDNQSKGPA